MENSFLPYSQLNGVPQESKLVTYMSRPNAVTPVNLLTDSLGALSVDGDLTTRTGLMGLGRNGESPANLAPSPVRASPVGMSMLNDNAPIFQPDAQYKMSYAKPSLTSSEKYYSGTGARRGPRTSIEQTAPEPPQKSIRQSILEKNALLYLQPESEYFPGLPAEVGNYTDLLPIEPLPPPEELALSETSTYKATHNKTGVCYCLRRIHGFRFTSPKSMYIIDTWKKLSHVNIVKLREVFTTRDFGDNSLVLVYDYHPGSQTLWQKHLSPADGNTPAPFSADPNAPAPYSHTKNALLRHQQSAMLSENLIWTYIIQMTAALRAIHSANIACRMIDPSKVIISSGNRLRLSCTGAADVLNSDLYHSQSLIIPHNQQEDLAALGKLVMVLACRSMIALENIPTALDLIGRTYSNDLKNLISYLLNTGQIRSVVNLMPMIGARFYVQLENLQAQADEMEEELARELDNSRLFRLVTKLATINDRPEFNLDTTWSETGDRYMLKLFRDYLYHQVTEDGRPWLDKAHIVQCLNKLESGSPEKLCLMSRDEQSVLVVTYEELKHCLEQSFVDLLSAATSKSEGLLPQ